MARKSLKERLAKHNADEKAAHDEVSRKFSGLRAADILRSNGADQIEAGITNIAEHPDMKAALGTAGGEAPKAEAKGEGRRST